jgi:hypothetical protein
MATLSEKQRDKLPDSKFGLPEEHKYPMPGRVPRPEREGPRVSRHEKAADHEGRGGEDRPKADRILDK